MEECFILCLVGIFNLYVDMAAHCPSQLADLWYLELMIKMNLEDIPDNF